MTQLGGIPSIYTDVSNDAHDFFTFRFTCEECHLFFDSKPKRSIAGVANKFGEVGIKALDGFGLWQKAAEAGEKVVDTEQEKEKEKALAKAWIEVQGQFRFCQSCHRTVCARCFHENMRVCIGAKCAPDLQADGALYAYQKQREAQRQQIEQQYAAPPNVAAPVTPPAQQQYTPQPAYAAQAQQPAPQATGAMAQTCPTCARQAVACPTCRKMGNPGKFCLDCGSRLPLTSHLCPRCNMPIENGARFCAECGTRLG